MKIISVIVLPYLLPIGCLQWVACVCKDHPGGYMFYFPENKSQRRATARNPSEEPIKQPGGLKHPHTEQTG